MTAHRKLYRTREIKPALGKLSDFGLRISPLLPKAAPNSSPNPGVEFRNRRPVLRMPEVVHPSAYVEVKLGDAVVPRDSPASPGKFPDAMLEVFEGFYRPPNSTSWECKSQELALIRLLYLAFSGVNLELQLLLKKARD